MMAVPEEAALRQAEIEVMRAVQRSIDATTRQLESLGNKVDKQGESIADVRERLIRQEERNNQVAEIKSRMEKQDEEINALRSERDRRAGATNLVEWIIKHWPGVIGFMLLLGLILRTSGQLKL